MMPDGWSLKYTLFFDSKIWILSAGLAMLGSELHTGSSGAPRGQAFG